MQNFNKEKFLWIIPVAIVLLLIQIYQHQRIKNRQAEVIEAQWYAEYGVPLPPDKTAEECLNNPRSCTDI